MKKAKLGTGTRFKKLTAKLKKQGVKNPKALAAAIGRKKYGKKKFQQLAARGKRKWLKKLNKKYAKYFVTYLILHLVFVNMIVNVRKLKRNEKRISKI